MRAAYNPRTLVVKEVNRGLAVLKALGTLVVFVPACPFFVGGVLGARIEMLS
jgi:hypothetical protein